MNALSQPPSSQQNCLQCRHYYITHDAGFMHGCRMFQMKSQRLPMLEVIAASGKVCEGFAEKIRKKTE